MGCILTDADIRNLRDEGELDITPFKEECLTPVGYDLRVGKLGFSWRKRKFVNIEKGGKIVINPGETVLVSTMENVSVSNRIAGTIHSKVSLSFGFSHVSTTVDPGWKGNMLVQIGNIRKVPLTLEYGQPFCTLVLHETKSAAKKEPPKRPNLEKFIEFLLKEDEARVSRIKRILASRIWSTVISVLLGYAIVLGIVGAFSYIFGFKIDTTTMSSIVIGGAALSAALLAKI